jgi:hypothetical protein
MAVRYFVVEALPPCTDQTTPPAMSRIASAPVMSHLRTRRQCRGFLKCS